MTAPTFSTPHRRYDPLADRWVLVSAHRTDRPWQGSLESPPPEVRPTFDPTCYLCPGVSRATGATNPDYDGTFVFTNDFPALVPVEHPEEGANGNLMRAEVESGTCRVVCFSPRHDLTIAEMDVDAIEQVVGVWAAQTAELGETHRWVQVFENKGEAMGASNPHPHGQIWAGSAIPSRVAAEDASQASHLAEHGTRLLADYLDLEAADGSRIVVENAEWVVVVPYWAVWPFETLVLPRRHVRRLPDLDDDGRHGLADILKQLTVRYDNLFENSFPYSMGWHGAPFDDGDHDHWQLHGHFYPPLLRSATVRKFLVGYELLAEPQRDLTPEDAAERLRRLPAIHYLERAETRG